MKISQIQYRTTNYSNSVSKPKTAKGIAFCGASDDTKKQKATDKTFQTAKDNPDALLMIFEELDKKGVLSDDVFNDKNSSGLNLYAYISDLCTQESKKVFFRKDKKKIAQWEKLGSFIADNENFDPNVKVKNKYGAKRSLIEYITENGSYHFAFYLMINPRLDRTEGFVDPENKKTYDRRMEWIVPFRPKLAKSLSNENTTGTSNSTKPVDENLRKYLVVSGEYDPKSLDEIGGMFEAKKAIKKFIVKPWEPEIREVLKENKIEMPNGFMMYGPPGCGKTYIVKAIANEMKVPLIKINMGEIGDSAAYATQKTLQSIFEAAEKDYETKKRPIIVFMDEIDTICGSRTNTQTDWRRDEINCVLQLINNAAQKGIILIGATNLIDGLDEAVLRTGRFDKKIEINKPTDEERKEILTKFIKRSPIAKGAEKYIDKLVQLTEGATCSDLSAIFNNTLRESIMFRDKKPPTFEDFKKAYEELKFEQTSGIKHVTGFSTKN